MGDIENDRRGRIYRPRIPARTSREGGEESDEGPARRIAEQRYQSARDMQFRHPLVAQNE